MSVKVKTLISNSPAICHYIMSWRSSEGKMTKDTNSSLSEWVFTLWLTNHNDVFVGEIVLLAYKIKKIKELI